MQFSKYFLAGITLASALALSAIAAYYSILGLTIIFAGGLIGFILMEVAKVVSTVYLHKYWNSGIGIIKYGLALTILAMMLITSMGTFGYFSRASIGQTENVSVNSAQVEFLEGSIDRNQQMLDNNNTQINQFNDAMSRLITDNPTRASRERRQLQAQIKRLSDENKIIAEEISRLNSELIPFKTEIKKSEVEIGPLLYIAKLIYKEEYKQHTESVLSWLIIILVLVFDPVAIMLLIASQHAIRYESMKDIKDDVDIVEDESLEAQMESRRARILARNHQM